MKAHRPCRDAQDHADDPGPAALRTAGHQEGAAVTLDPQAKALLDAFAAMPAVDYERIDAAQMRARNDARGVCAPGGAGEREETHTTRGPGAPLRLRLYRGAAGELLPLLAYF